MNISIKQMRAFIAVARSGSFAQAAETLHLTQPALSSAISKMEHSVGGSLFDRTTRRVTMTPEARHFLPIARRLISDWDQSLEDLNRSYDLKQGSLNIAVMPSFAMNEFPKAIALFQKQHPGINIRVRDIVMEDVIDSVSSGAVDLGIAFEPDSLDGVSFQPLFVDRWLAIVPCGHVQANQDTISWRRLAQQPFVVMNSGSWSRQMQDEAMRAAGVSSSGLFEANQFATIGKMVSMGVGVSLVPALCQKQMEGLGVKCLSVSNPMIKRRVGIFTSLKYPLSSAAKKMDRILLNTFHR